MLPPEGPSSQSVRCPTSAWTHRPRHPPSPAGPGAFSSGRLRSPPVCSPTSPGSCCRRLRRRRPDRRRPPSPCALWSPQVGVGAPSCGSGPRPRVTERWSSRASPGEPESRPRSARSSAPHAGRGGRPATVTRPCHRRSVAELTCTRGGLDSSSLALGRLDQRGLRRRGPRASGGRGGPRGGRPRVGSAPPARRGRQGRGRSTSATRRGRAAGRRASGAGCGAGRA